MLKSVVLVLYFPLDEREQFLVVVDALVDGGVLAHVLFVSQQVLLHVVYHVRPVHVVWVEVRGLHRPGWLPAVHLLVDRSCCDH